MRGTPAAPANAVSRGAVHVIEDVEVLRGVAICMVFVEHLPVNLLWWNSPLGNFAGNVWRGAMGVDLFFTISGFVIARGLLPKLLDVASAADVSGALRAFFIRRAFRLLPSAWLWLAIPLWLSHRYGIASEFGDFDRNWVMSEYALFNIANFYEAITVDLALSHIRFWGPSNVFWSLSLEEQFYLLFPVVALICRSWLWVVLGAALVFQFVVPLTALTDFTRPGALAMGVLLAIAARKPWYDRLRPAVLEQSGLLRGALLATCVALLGVLGVQSTSLKLGLVALISGLLVFVASFDRDCVWPDRWTKRAMVWVGSRSYSLYLAHMTALCGVRQVVHQIHGWAPPHSQRLEAGAVCAAILLALALTEATYRLVERPTKQYGRLLSLYASPTLVAVR